MLRLKFHTPLLTFGYPKNTVQEIYYMSTYLVEKPERTRKTNSVVKIK